MTTRAKKTKRGAAEQYDAKMEEVAALLTESYDLVVPAMGGPEPDWGYVGTADEMLIDLRAFMAKLRFLAGVPQCPWTSEDECKTARERSVAGTDHWKPICPVHGE